MATLTHSSSAAVRRNLPKVMAELTRLFKRVAKESLDGRGNVSVASRWMGVPIGTIRRRIKKKDIPVALVLATPQLAERFRRAMCTKDHHEPAGYIARKRKRARVKR